MSIKNVCPTVPPLYTWDSGTSHTGRDMSWDKVGTRSLKALVLERFPVPLGWGSWDKMRDNLQNLVPRKALVLGQKKALSHPTEIDPRSLDYARSLLVACPGKGRKLHCWHCSRCGYAPRCNAWRRHFRQVKEFEGRGKPYSLLLLEDMAALDAPGVLQ